jgi:cytochrome P450
MKQRVHWLALHGVTRLFATAGARRGDPQARMLADPSVLADPVSFYEELRPRGPLIHCRISHVTVDHAVAHQVLRSDDFRPIKMGATLPRPFPWLQELTRPDGLHPLRPPSLLAVEPPDHTRYRKSVSAVFTPRAVAALRERVETRAHDLLDRLAGQSVVDIVADYCAQLPVSVISDILGVPEGERTRVLEFGELVAPSLDIGLTWPQFRQVQRGLEGFDAWLRGHIENLRRNPGDDLMSELIRLSDADGQLDDVELRATAGLVLAAGFETTVNLLGNGIRMLMDHPEQLEELQAHPELWPNAVEEILRLDSPVQLTGRVAKTDVEVAGTQLRRDDLVVCYLAAANRDPAVFADPHRFDVRRENSARHLAFSGGRHFCLGAALARAEGEVGLRAFFDRFPTARGAGAGRRRETRVLRGYAHLPVALGAARDHAGAGAS